MLHKVLPQVYYELKFLPSNRYKATVYVDGKIVKDLYHFFLLELR